MSGRSGNSKRKSSSSGSWKQKKKSYLTPHQRAVQRKKAQKRIETMTSSDENEYYGLPINSESKEEFKSIEHTSQDRQTTTITFMLPPGAHFHSLQEMLEVYGINLLESIQHLLRTRRSALKIILKVLVTFERASDSSVVIHQWFSGYLDTLYSERDVNAFVAETMHKIQDDIEGYTSNGSDWLIISVDQLSLN